MEPSIVVIRVIAGIYGFLLFAHLIKLLFRNVDIPLVSEGMKDAFYWGTLISVTALIITFFLLESGLATFIPSLNPDWSLDYLEKYIPDIGIAIDDIPDFLRSRFNEWLSFLRWMIESYGK